MASAGAGAYLYYSGHGRKLVQKANTMIEERNDARDKHQLAQLLDEVVHQDDIPDTPVKQAFEQAVHGEAHR
ncbi:hypothetical protein D3C72_2483570 [compost metagenome]